MNTLNIYKVSNNNDYINISGNTNAAMSIGMFYRGYKYTVKGNSMYIEFYYSLKTFSKKKSPYFDEYIKGDFANIDKIYFRCPDSSESKAIINFSHKHKDNLIWIKNNAVSTQEDKNNIDVYTKLLNANKDKSEILKQLQAVLELYKTNNINKVGKRYSGLPKAAKVEYPVLNNINDFEITDSYIYIYDIKVAFNAGNCIMLFFLNNENNNWIVNSVQINVLY